MEVVKSLFVITLGSLKPKQLREYFVSDVHGNELKLLLNIPFSNKTIELLVKTFESCKFKKIDMIIKHDRNQVECKFINLKVSKYNPINDNGFMNALNKTVVTAKKYPLSTVNVARIHVPCSDRVDKKKFKNTMSNLIIELSQSYLTSFGVMNKFLRVSAYDCLYNTNEPKITFEIKLIPHLIKNEICTDEL